MSAPGRLKRLFTYAPPDPVGFWRARASQQGTLSVMWLNDAYNQRAQEDQWQAIERNFPARRGSVLDLGCGTGRLTGRLATAFDRYTGVDLDTMVAEARRRNPDVRAEFVVSKVQDYEFEPEGHDLVLSMACLGNACRAEELPDMARGMVAALRPGGHVVMIDAFHTIPALTRICRASARHVIELFEGLGVELVEWTGLHFVPVRMVLARPTFAGYPALVQTAYAAGEVVLGLAPRRLSDYSVIALRKP